MENLYNQSHQEENILDGLDINLVQATSGKRFVNLLFDRVFLYVLWKYLLLKLIVAAIISSGIVIESRAILTIGIWCFLALFDVLCLAAMEFLTGGKTIGKYLSGTRAVNSDGTRISLKTAVLRNLSRVVPFEAFSALGNPCYPWHDRWTNTLVIDERLSQLP